jgi:hypothetical protein
MGGASADQTIVFFCFPIAVVLTLAIVLGAVGIWKRDKRLFFVGLSACGLLILVAGILMTLVFALDGTGTDFE